MGLAWGQWGGGLQARVGEAKLSKGQPMANRALSRALLGHKGRGDGRTVQTAALCGSLFGPQTCPGSLKEAERGALHQPPTEEGEGLTSLFMRRGVCKAQGGIRPGREAAKFSELGIQHCGVSPDRPAQKCTRT